MVDQDHRRPWYHGSQQPLTTLRAGSSITHHIAVARAFSHRPSLVSQAGDGTVKHDGTTPGYLHVVAEEIRPEDIYPHPHPVNAARWEWLTRRAVRVQLLERTAVRGRATDRRRHRRPAAQASRRRDGILLRVTDDQGAAHARLHT